MTAGELIKELEKYPKNMRVVEYCGGDAIGLCDIEIISAKQVALNYYTESHWGGPHELVNSIYKDKDKGTKQKCVIINDWEI